MKWWSVLVVACAACVQPAVLDVGEELDVRAAYSRLRSSRLWI
jgi:hypothetical protein